MKPRETNPNFLAGVPELLILRLLKDREMYGYELVQAVRDQTQTTISFSEGVIYPVLHALERDGALRAHRATVNGRSRVYYAITETGSARFVELAKTWTKLAGAISRVLMTGATATSI